MIFYCSHLGNDQILTVCLRSSTHSSSSHYSGARQLNQENIFITVYCIILAFGYTVHYVAKRSNVVKINNVQVNQISYLCEACWTQPCYSNPSLKK